MRFFKKKPEGPKNVEVRETGFSGRPGAVWEVDYGRDYMLSTSEGDGFYLSCAPQAAPKKPETFRCEYCGAPKLKRTCAYCGSK